MPVQPFVFPGEWTDVDWSPADGCFVFAYLQQPGAIVLRRAFNDGNTEQVDAIALNRWALYLRCAADGQGNVCCVLQDGRDRNPATGQFYPAIVVLFPKDSPPREIPCPAGPAFGQNAVEVFRNANGAFSVLVMTSDRTMWWGHLYGATGAWGHSGVMGTTPTSQGFADQTLLVDLVRSSVPGMVCPSSVDGLSIGQNTDGPDRIRGLYAGSYFTVLAGTAFEPHLASDGHGAWMACARTLQGAALVALTPPFEPEPTVLPDIEWIPDPTKTVDLAPYVRESATAVKVIDAARGWEVAWCHKSPEHPEHGEWFGITADAVGLLCDTSTGTRMVSYPRHAVASRPHKNLTRDRMGRTEVEALGLGPWESLPLAGYTNTPNGLFAPRIITGRWEATFDTYLDWFDEPQYVSPGGVHGRWELHTVRFTMGAEAGYGRFNGYEVHERTFYRKPDGQEESNFWGEQGRIRFHNRFADGTLEESSVRVRPPGQWTNQHGPFVESRQPYLFPITPSPSQPARPLPPDPDAGTQPPPKETPDVLPNDEQALNALRRIHVEGYIGELRRAGGIFETPDLSSQIYDPRPYADGGEVEPANRDRIDDKSLSVWFSRYVRYFSEHPNAPGGPHEFAIRAVLRDLHNSDEARQKRGETGGGGSGGGPIVAPVPLHIDGTTFRRQDGTIWKYRMVTAFTAFQDFLAGNMSKLDTYAAWTRSVGGNGWRVFYTWAVTGFNPLKQLGPQALLRELQAFRRYQDQQGLYGHHTALCDQIGGSPVLLSGDDQDTLLEQLRLSMPGHVLEAMNEAYKNGGYALSGRFPAAMFAGTFGTRSSWQDGERPDAPGPLLACTSEHTPRDAEWPRKAKNLLETSRQGIQGLVTGMPAIAGEPIGIFEVDQAQPARTANASDVADYFAVAELFGAGACLHGDGSTLQRCQLPGPNAQRCAEWAKAAREAIPAEAQLGHYTRGGLDDCPLEHSDSLALRTFAMLGLTVATAVVVRPQPGWEPKARNGWRIESVGGPNGHVVRLVR